jgi:hypothetical protein
MTLSIVSSTSFGGACASADVVSVLVIYCSLS